MYRAPYSPQLSGFSFVFLGIVVLSLLLSGCSDGPMGPADRSNGAEQGDSDSSDPDAPDLSGQSAPAPHISSYGIKQLGITWDEVAGADFYRLWISDNGGQAYQPVVEAPPGATVKHPLSAHLTLDTTAYLEACNAASCTAPSPITRLADLYEAGEFKLDDTIGVFQPATLVVDGGRTFRPVFKGYSLAASQDGKRWAAGIPALSEYKGDAPGELDFQGGFITYGGQDGSWSQEAYNLDPEQPQAGSYLGLALAMSADGQWFVVSAPRRSLVLEDRTVSNAGVVYVYRRNNRDDGWVANQVIIPPSADSIGHFGMNLALSSDGSTLAIVTPATTNNRGRVQLYQLENNRYEWRETLVNPGGVFADKRFGEGVALSPDGRYLAVGAPNVYGPDLFGGSGLPLSDNTEAVVGLWRAEQEQWRLVTSEVVKDADISGFGERLVFFKDGGYLLIGAPDSEDGRGKAFVYQVLQAGAVLQAVTSLQPPRYITDVDGRAFGMRLAASPDGNTLAIGAPFSGIVPAPGTTDPVPDVGAVFVYRSQGAEWPLESVLTPTHARKESAFGLSLAVADDGRMLLVGTPAQVAEELATADGGQSTSFPAGAVFMY